MRKLAQKLRFREDLCNLLIQPDKLIAAGQSSSRHLAIPQILIVAIQTWSSHVSLELTAAIPSPPPQRTSETQVRTSYAGGVSRPSQRVAGFYCVALFDALSGARIPVTTAPRPNPISQPSRPAFGQLLYPTQPKSGQILLARHLSCFLCKSGVRQRVAGGTPPPPSLHYPCSALP